MSLMTNEVRGFYIYLLTTLHVRSPELSHLTTENLYPLTNIFPFLQHPQSLETIILPSVSMSFFFLRFYKYCDQIAFVFGGVKVSYLPDSL